MMKINKEIQFRLFYYFIKRNGYIQEFNCAARNIQINCHQSLKKYLYRCSFEDYYYYVNMWGEQHNPYGRKLWYDIVLRYKKIPKKNYNIYQIKLKENG